MPWHYWMLCGVSAYLLWCIWGMGGQARQKARQDAMAIKELQNKIEELEDKINRLDEYVTRFMNQ